MIIFRKNDNDINNNVERVEANVKWYHPEKGYGFLNREDNSGDIMIHFSTLATIGCVYLKEGDRVICEVAPGKAGTQVIRVIDVKFGSPEPRSLSAFLSSRTPSFNPEDLEGIEGIIKWFNPDKGYGFISPNDGGREIFLHSSVVRKAGYKALEPGLRVLIKVSHSERGPEAQMLTVIWEETTEEKREAS